MTTARYLEIDGRQATRPRIDLAPPSLTHAGLEASELAASAGLELDAWQRYALDRILGERPDGQWAARETGLIVPRQNGKGSILEARELAGLFLFGEELILHSAHEFKTAQEAFRRLLLLIEQTPHLARRVARIRTSHGEEGIELTTGQRIRFVARSTGSGRGFSGDVVVLDEAYALTPAMMGALIPTLSARPNPQIIYTSSAGMRASEALALIRKRAIDSAKGIAYLEWSAGKPKDHTGRTVDLDDVEDWAQANPAYPHRISFEAIEAERRALNDDQFARERLGVWEGSDSQTLIDPDVWYALLDKGSTREGDIALAIDVAPDQRAASIAVAGLRSDKIAHIEIVDARPGTSWVADRVAEIVSRRSPVSVSLDPGSYSGALIPDLTLAGVELNMITGRQYVQACGLIYDRITSKQIRHIGQPELAAAVDAARKRRVGEAWAFTRRDTDTDISPLVSCTLALYGLLSAEPKSKRSGKASFNM